MVEKKKKRVGGRKKQMTSRIALNLTPDIPPLVERVVAVLRRSKNYEPVVADVLRKAILAGLRQMLVDEGKE